ncbi:hypothetical protein, partial [Salmonella enterica]|uniref:hypothetical protein n=1 Tax=Salmonella enterica TaxID=28901 RepID=UPI0035245BCE
GWEGAIGIQLASDQYRGFYLTDAGSAISPGVFMFGIPPRLHMHRPNTKPWPKSVVLEAWKQPDPRFEVTIADNFRGHLRLNATPFELIELASGQRIVPVRPNPYGVVTLP